MIGVKRRLRFFWLYLCRNVPWDSGIVPPEIVAWITAAEASGTPPGRALDLGCGTGTTSIYLAARGWDTVGVDYVPLAIRQARRKATQQKLVESVMFAVADVSRRDFLRDASPFDLVIDIGCLHGLTPDQRAAYATHLIRLTRPGATFLLYAFLPDAGKAAMPHPKSLPAGGEGFTPPLSPLPVHGEGPEVGFTLAGEGLGIGASHRGIDSAGLQALLGPAFEIADCVMGEDSTRPVGSAWYTLRRTGFVGAFPDGRRTAQN